MNIGSETIDDGGKRILYGENLAMREPTSGKGRFDLITPFGLERLAKWYELGSQKYADRNWEKGMPFSRYIDSAERHINKFKMVLQMKIIYQQQFGISWRSYIMKNLNNSNLIICHIM